MTSLPSWPPSMTPEEEANLLELATDYALGNGIVYRPPTEPNGLEHPSQTTVIHAPYSLLPTPFPRKLYNQAQSLQPLYNALYAHVTVDDDFLHQIVGGAVAKVDEFQGQLYDIWRQVKKEGIKQPLHLGLFRSDYLIHAPPGTPLEQQEIRQVEFNTISASFGSLSTKVADLHRYLFATGAYPDAPELSLEAIPVNPALQGLAAGLAAGHRAYGVSTAQILMVTQDDERNAFDQRPLEYELLQRHNIHLVRIPFSVLHARLTLSSSHQLLLHPPPSSSHTSSPSPSPNAAPNEISVVYYRTGYAPTDYYTAREWSSRLLIERSTAIKCPTVALQLAGCKKVQQVLAEPGRLSSFFDIGSSSSSSTTNDNDGGDSSPIARLTVSKGDEVALRASFSALYPMDDSPLGLEGQRLARDPVECLNFVLKPQREGGGNNVYRGDIPGFMNQLDEKDQERQRERERRKRRGDDAGQDEDEDEDEDEDMVVKEREGYILMSLIQVPDDVRSVMVRAGQGKGTPGDVVSELGVYGVALFRAAQSQKEKEEGRGAEILVNETVGTLLRTKGRESDEGGVAVGFSVIDSVLLV